MPSRLTPEVESLLALSATKHLQSLVQGENEATVLLVHGVELRLAPVVKPGDAVDDGSGWRFTLNVDVPDVPHDGDHLGINLARTFWEMAGLLLPASDQFVATLGGGEAQPEQNAVAQIV